MLSHAIALAQLPCAKLFRILGVKELKILSPPPDFEANYRKTLFIIFISINIVANNNF